MASASSTSFAPSTGGVTPYTLLFEQYALLTRTNPGWSLTESRDIPVRERVYWLQLALRKVRNV